ncbi:MAG: DUF4197 domain-containing protein [Acidobacteriota bacterium]
MRSLKLLLAISMILIVSYDAASVRAKSNRSTPASSVQDDNTKALREVLLNGSLNAVNELGRLDGFYKNPRVKIPMPKSLQTVEKTLRFIGQKKAADDFVLAMNRAAEKAVPAAVEVFKNAARQMTFTDAVRIVKGPDDAATQFFRKTSEENLRAKFLPVVRKFTEEVGVTAQYKNLIKQAGPIASLAGKEATDIDGYVTQKALDGLFLLMADEERRIRRDPIARTSEILRKVFGIGRR